MINCFFVSDLHGKVDRYRKLISRVLYEKPDAIFLGGDLLPSGLYTLINSNKTIEDFVQEFLIPEFVSLKKQLRDHYPKVYLILGNDDGRFNESVFIEAESLGIWNYIHNRKKHFMDYTVYGYSHIPPSPFQLKDWERYDVSRFVDPGCVSPEEGRYTIQISEDEKKYSTIQNDLKILTENCTPLKVIFLFHAPPYKSNLDRAALDNKMFDHAPLDVHIGSIAIKQWIEEIQPLVTLHGHVHESANLTGKWSDILGKTNAYSGAHDGSELALVRFDPTNLQNSTRELI